MSTVGWRITWRGEFKSGTYYAINTSPVVTVKARALPGPPYFCERCITNDCEHTAWIAEQDTPDTEAA